MAEEVKHYQVEQRYKVIFERGATKGVDGFKVEANGDNYGDAFTQALELYTKAVTVTTPAEVKKDEVKF